ncbi:thioredoxin family protein [Sulfurovum mangrovi]|uniref:thioredoxin family protein n=1 Tax=Sulfurovum mangrovi TaxID=2893889 RepID=UPI001E3FB082|nr:thioredoxin family protein [Sulfurovum mangrovi]UFH60110.1 thioredoxin family protein [Sulfurovum mangrovi]
MKFLISTLLLLSTLLHAESFFILNHIKKVYPVIEIQTDKIDKNYKSDIRTTMQDTLKELGIDSSGYDPRALALVIYHDYIGETLVIHTELVMGEEVRRLDDGQKTFGLTYQDKEDFVVADVNDTDGIQEGVEDSIDSILSRFADQYRDDNKLKPKKSHSSDENFAEMMGYETDYQAALKKAKKEHKNLMLVLTTSYCPWCRKFETNVLQKEEVNKAVHEKYVPLTLNRDEKQFPAKFTSSFTPVIYFIDASNEKILHKVTGYSQREEFLYLLK